MPHTFLKKRYNKALLFTLCFLLSLPLFFLYLSSSKAASLPIPTSYYNTNTYTNLNTITNTENITFTITYDLPGDIKWYKDGTLIQTDTNINTATLTTNWTAADYTQVKELKVNSTTIDGTSTDTIWKVEVQETGTATIEKHIDYP